MNTPKTDALYEPTLYSFRAITADEGYAFACHLERENAELRKALSKCNAEFKAMRFLGYRDMEKAIADTNAVLERANG